MIKKMFNEDYVSYDLAVKLHEVDFDWVCSAYYAVEPDGNPCLWKSTLSPVYRADLKGRDVIAPTLAMAQKWLREVKEINVLVWDCACGYGWSISKAGNEQRRGTTIIEYDDEGEDKANGMWLTYESALSSGILKAIKYILI